MPRCNTASHYPRSDPNDKMRYASAPTYRQQGVAHVLKLGNENCRTNRSNLFGFPVKTLRRIVTQWMRSLLGRESDILYQLLSSCLNIKRALRQKLCLMRGKHGHLRTMLSGKEIICRGPTRGRQQHLWKRREVCSQLLSHCTYAISPLTVRPEKLHKVNQDVVEDSAHSTKLTIVNKNQCE